MDTDQQHNIPTSHVLSILQDLDGDGNNELTNMISLVNQQQRYSDWWDHAPTDGRDNGVVEHSQLDHLLVSDGLRALVSRVWIDHTHNPATVSDHWPLVCRCILKFELGLVLMR